MDTKQTGKSVLGFLSASALLWAGLVSDASINRRPEPIKRAMVPSSRPVNFCKDDLGILQTKGTFKLKNSNTPMAFYMGYANAKKALAKKLEARLASVAEDAELCEAVCQLVHVARYQSDGHPQLIQFECSGSKVNPLKMPVFIEWTKTESSDYQASIRMGSVFTKVVTAPIALQNLEPTPTGKPQQWAKR